MPSINEEIKKYDVEYYGGGKNTAGFTYRAIIGLRRDDGSLIGGAYFHRNPATLPDSDDLTPANYIWCHYTAEDFPRILDLLRNEKPVYFRYVAGNWKMAAITTSAEPVGEKE